MASTAVRPFNTVLYRTEGPVAIITLNRPQVLNAFNTEMLVETLDALRQADADGAVRVVIINGAGERAFCAGADLREIQDNGPREQAIYNQRWLDMYEQMERMRKPIIASVHGYAPAGGTELILACDLVVAAADAQLALTEINVGVFPGAGATIRLTRWVGRARAKEMLFTGQFLGAEQALQWGLVNRVVPRERLHEETMALAQTLAKKSPIALGAAKAAVNVGSEMDMEKGVQYALREFLLLFTTEDQKEGMRAFLEKREPRFSGR